MSGHRPDRNSDVAAWIRSHRDRNINGYKLYDTGRYDALDDLLDDYRLHADTGTPLSEEAQENPKLDPALRTEET